MSGGGVSGKGSSYPMTKVVELGGFRIGLTHGHNLVPWNDSESLAFVQRQVSLDGEM